MPCGRRQNLRSRVRRWPLALERQGLLSARHAFVARITFRYLTLCVEGSTVKVSFTFMVTPPAAFAETPDI